MALPVEPSYLPQIDVSKALSHCKIPEERMGSKLCSECLFSLLSPSFRKLWSFACEEEQVSLQEESPTHPLRQLVICPSLGTSTSLHVSTVAELG